jgi:ABC-2 type transport system ATP-binding protein
MDVSSGVKIKAEEILVRFGNVVALDRFSAEVPQGIVGLLGPNGAGKSTFIRVALGLLEAQRGRITVDGLNPQLEPVLLRDKIGYMPEDECLIQNQNAFELVSYMAQLSGLSPEEATKRSHAVLDFIGFGEERYREISTYSTGMKQQVKLAQSIVHDPPILLFDEPTSGMDPGAKEDMLSLIGDLGKHRKTILVCSHLLHEVERISDHVLIINEGRLIRAGDLDQVLKGEENRYKLEIRGSTDSNKAFVDDLDQFCEVLDAKYGGGKLTVVIKGVAETKEYFRLAKQHDVQIRSYVPDRLSLEDFFVEAFEEDGRNAG